MSYLPCEIIEPKNSANAAVIWLHGLGASGHDFVPIVPELKLPESLAVRFIFPHAPTIPVTINGGMAMPAWYDILAMDIEREIDNQQIMASSDAVKALIEREIAHGIPSDKIVLAGFSQGGAVCYQAALTYNKPLAGLMTMSTYFATYKTIVPDAANKSLPMHLFHGTQDQMVPEAMGKQALEVLTLLGHKPQYKNYPMGHEVNPQEIADIANWLLSVLV